jgi:hypothetical protein
MSTIRERIERVYDYLREQLAETSTIRGIAGLLVLGGGTAAKWPLEVTLFVAGVVGAVLKIMLPDDLPWGDK